MTRKHTGRRVLALIAISVALIIPAAAKRTVAQKKQAAHTQFETAERMREALNGRAAADRTRRDYTRVLDAYRAVYYTAPSSNRADASVVAVAELLVEVGRQFHDEKALRAAIAQYEFLRREYPGSRFRVQALFTMAQVYKDDLDDTAQARQTFEEFLKRYQHSELADDARGAVKELDEPAMEAVKPKTSTSARTASQDPSSQPKHATLVTGIRHWSTPDYTRVAIDLQDAIDYQYGRVPNPDRVFFDLHNTHLSSTLKGKSFDVEDGFLHRVRVAQYQLAETRIVLELDDVAEYTAFLLPNPYRLIIDIHGKHPQKMAKADPPKPEVEKKSERSLPEAAVAAPVESARTEPEKKADTTANVTQKPARDATFADFTQKVAKVSPPEPSLKTPISDVEEKPTTKVVKKSLPPSTKRGKTTTVRKSAEPLPGREAQPTAKGERSLIRALGLKIGRIVVDAGHGGHDTGTIGPNGLLEKDLVLEVAQRLGKLLESRLGAEVVYTRDDDTFVPLETRTAIANQNEADLFISIHANSSSDPAARGIETYYLNFTTSADALEVAARENAVSEKSIHELQDLVKKIALKDKIEESREFAVDVQQALYSGLANHWLRNRGVKKAPFIVLIGANMPSILAEISFVSNPADARKLRTPEYRQKIAESLFRGTAKYVNGLSGLKVASRGPKPGIVPVSSTSQRSVPASTSNE